MNNPPKYLPKYLYLYDRMKGDYTRSIFLDNLIGFSSPLKFNDPFDSKIPIKFDGNSEPYINSFLRNMNRHQKRVFKKKTKNIDINEASKKAQKQILTEDLSVLCLSVKYDDILMFSHYADKHKGFCLQFECRKDSNFATARKVCYSKKNKFPKINRLQDSNPKLLKGTLLVKSWNWQYEKEYRIILKKKEGTKSFEGQCLTGVIFGCKMEPEDKKLIEGWINERKHPIKIYHTSPNNNYFKLNFDPCEPEQG